MAQTILNQDTHVRGTLSCARFVAPTGSIGNAAIPASAGISEGKLQHRHVLTYSQAEGFLRSATHYLYGMRFDGAVLAITAAISEPRAPAGELTIDLERSRNGAAFASILSEPITFDDDSTELVLVEGAISDSDLVAEDLLRLVVTVEGGIDSEAGTDEGLLVNVTVRENGQ